MTIDLYYWPTPNGWKVSIALEEMGLPYETTPVNIGAGDQFAPWFATVSPNHKMPAIVDRDGPDGEAVSIFESGAILQYLARKTGRFHGQTERARIAVEEWLFWQVANVGPMAGQAHHFLRYAPHMDPPQDIAYAKDRYRREVARLYGVLDKRLGETRYAAGDFYSIADMAIWPWVSGWERQEQTLDDKPNLARWLDELGNRPAVKAGRALLDDKRTDLTTDKEAQKILFQRGA